MAGRWGRHMSGQQPDNGASDEPRSVSRRNTFKLLGAGGGVAAASMLLAACNGAQSSAAGNGGVGSFPSTPKWKFVFVNHVTTNSFFVPTRNGLADAAAMLDVATPQWTGSETGDVSEMVSAFDSAISSGADGIAIALTDSSA